jgi:hypothetical protein
MKLGYDYFGKLGNNWNSFGWRLKVFDVIN